MNFDEFVDKLIKNELHKLEQDFNYSHISNALNLLDNDLNNKDDYLNFQKNFANLIINNPKIIENSRLGVLECSESKIISYLNKIENFEVFKKYRDFIFDIKDDDNSYLKHHFVKLRNLLSNNNFDINENINFFHKHLVNNKYYNEKEYKDMYNLIINYYFANINIKYDALDIFAEDINNFGLENINESFEEFIYDIDETFVNDFYEYSDDEDIIFKYIETSFEKYNYFKEIVNLKDVNFLLYNKDAKDINWYSISHLSNLYDVMISDNLKNEKVDKDKIIKEYFCPIKRLSNYNSNKLTNIILDIINNDEYNIKVKFDNIISFEKLFEKYQSKLDIIIDKQEPSVNIEESIKKYGFDKIFGILIQLNFDGIEEYKKNIKEKYYNEMNNFEKQLIENNDKIKLELFNDFNKTDNNQELNTTIRKTKRKMF